MRSISSIGGGYGAWSAASSTRSSAPGTSGTLANLVIKQYAAMADSASQQASGATLSLAA